MFVRLRPANSSDATNIFDLIQSRSVGMAGSLIKHDYDKFLEDFNKTSFYVLEDESNKLLGVTKIVNKTPKSCFYVNRKDQILERLSMDCTELCGTYLDYRYRNLRLGKFMIFGSVLLYDNFLEYAVGEVLGDIDGGFCTFYDVYIAKYLKCELYEAELIPDVEKKIPRTISINKNYDKEVIGAFSSPGTYYSCARYMDLSDYICVLDGGPIFMKKSKTLIKSCEKDFGRYLNGNSLVMEIECNNSQSSP